MREIVFLGVGNLFDSQVDEKVGQLFESCRHEGRRKQGRWFADVVQSITLSGFGVRGILWPERGPNDEAAGRCRPSHSTYSSTGGSGCELRGASGAGSAQAELHF